ncbi:MAG: hypothetical protein EZS28_018759, partial [Streblomastix strix]
MNDGTITLSEIRIGNVNIDALDENKVNLLRDTYKLCLQKVTKITSILDLSQISSRVMQAVSQGLLALDALLLLRADKSELTDSYSKTEDDALLLLKVNVAKIVDSYSKQEDDALLLLKADKSELLDSYFKTEDDALLLLKADKSDTYSKTEDDALLLLEADKTELIDSYSKTEDNALLLLKADKSDTYSKTEDDALLLLNADVVDIVDSYFKTEDDALLLLKADKSNSCSKTEDDALLLLKDNVADIVDSYSKSEDDALLLLKAGQSELIDAYSKTEDDALLLLKADVADLTNYVDLTFAQIITGQKQFGVISVSCIPKQSNNDTFILLAGGGDMLVSSFVTQPQLQEFRDIVTGKSKAYVFSTQRELNDWMAIQDNVEKLIIGDYLYIVDKEVTDYWWDGTDLKVLETELPDMSNVVTTLGASTGGDNVITDISIDGNILTLAKNINFVDTDYDQSISGQKTFNTTIHSIGIMVQIYDNSNVVYAGGEVRSFADIQSDSYSKSEDNALLLLKADKTKLIDSYTKGETNNLLNNKADNGVSYTKGEDDALLLLKADKTQLIDSYTKGETNNFLNTKADNGVSYSKGENDDLLLLKADKTQLIDSYSKSETYARDEVYTKGEDDSLSLLKADKTQLIDSYTKRETDNLLNNKANQSTTYSKSETYARVEVYTKTETDQLILQIDIGDIDLTDYYNKTKTDELLGKKADATELSNYVTLGTSQTINANKTFINACRFVSTIDGMSTVTGSSFVKSDADDTVVLLVNGTTEPLSEFAGRLKYVSPFDYQDETQDYVANTYLTQSEVDTKLTNYFNTTNNQSLNGIKTFNADENATGFVNTGKDGTSVLQAGGGDRLLSAFVGVQVKDITNLVVDLHSNFRFNYLRLVRIGNYYHLMMDFQPKTQINVSTNIYVCTIGSFSNTITPPTPASAVYLISIVSRQITLIGGLATRQIRINTVSSSP